MYYQEAKACKICEFAVEEDREDCDKCQVHGFDFYLRFSSLACFSRVPNFVGLVAYFYHNK